MTERDWGRLDERVVYDGWIRVVERRYRLPDGRVATWQLRDNGDSVGVLAFTPDRHVVLVRQFRPGPDRRLVTLPGGLLDSDESPEAAGRRELGEETGFAADRVDVVATVTMPAAVHRQYVAIAYDCRPVGEQQLDEFEDCEVMVVPAAEVLRLLRAGEMGGTHLVWPVLDAAGLL